MSLWLQTYRRSAGLALVTAIVLIALPVLMKAQVDNQEAPKAELFVGYEWLNPGGDIPDRSVPPNAVHMSAIPQGGGASWPGTLTITFRLRVIGA